MLLSLITRLEVIHMTNIQVRLLASAIVMVAGALAVSSTSLDVNLGIVIIFLSGAVFIAEYVRSYMNK